MILSDIAEIRTNFPEANFWLVNYTNTNQVGKPTGDFQKEFIGIKAYDFDFTYHLYHMLMSFFKTGQFQNISRGIPGYVSLCLHSVQNLGVTKLDSDQRKILTDILTEVSNLQNELISEITGILEEDGQLCEKEISPIENCLQYFTTIGCKYTSIIDDLRIRAKEPV